jgi:hypothetical protein
LKKYFRGFGLQKTLVNMGRLDAWVSSAPDNRPKYGDILEHRGLHLDVALDFDDEILWRAAAGQGGKTAGHDIIKRVRDKSDYDPKKLLGWIDIAIYVGEEYADIL